MPIKRREFLKTTICSGAALFTPSLFDPRLHSAWAATPAAPGRVDGYPLDRHIVYRDGEEYMAFSTADLYHPYAAKTGPADALTWMQIDLGESRSIETVKLYPAIANAWGFVTDHFPKRFKIEISDEADFRSASIIADHTGADFQAGLLRIWPFPAQACGRYLRLTVVARAGDPKTGCQVHLSKIGVFSGDKDVAVGCPVTVDPVYGNLEGGKASRLTRPHRPMGEGILTDFPENRTPPATWKPPVQKLRTPLGGVELAGGLFRQTMENNIRYLLQTDTLDHHLRPFRERAGKPVGPDPMPQVRFWETYLPDSSAGRFLMGAGNTLRWIEHSALRARMNALVDGIEECQRSDGYLLAYDPETVFDCERGAYDRAWLTHGLIEAGRAGNPKAFKLLREHYDWFNQWPFLPKLLRGAGQGGQGMIANTRLYFTPAGKAGDILVIQRYFQENFWLKQLAERNPEAIWLYPYDRPHCYLLTNLEAYLDLYLATGDARYLEAVRGGWELFHDHWEHIGGTIAICEFGKYPPGSYLLQAHTGEFCGSVFWVRLNQRFHLLFPEEEKYVAEIEKSIYNVGLANQTADQGIIYTTRLVNFKDKGTHNNTCCEGQGTRLYGSLPEYIYSLAADGVYIDLFEPSTITWTRNGRPVQLQMETRFPFEPEVRLKFSGGTRVLANIRVRVPSWAEAPMEIRVNGQTFATGKPGAYVSLERDWSGGDTVFFTLPLAFRFTRYTGAEAAGQPLYALEYGPILMAAVGAKSARLKLPPGGSPRDLIQSLVPKESQPLCFSFDGKGPEYAPYWQIPPGQPFTCFSAVET